MYSNQKTNISLKDISILYIDDDQNTIEIILNDLNKCVHKITLARSKNEALEKFKSERFDLIITALDIGEVDGFQVLKNIRKIEPDIHAIVLMENCTKEFAKGMSDINILNDYISKTQSISILNKFIRKSIQKTISRRNFKEAYALLGQYKVALDESWIVIKTDLQGNITYVNNNFSQISLYSEDEILGRPLSILTKDTEQNEILKDLWQTIQAKKVFKSELKLNKKNGEFFFVKSTIIPVMDVYDKIIEYISISFDITELKNALKRAQDARKAKSIFLANMSHDIRIPLNGILGFSRLLKTENLAKREEHQYIDIINQSASSLLGIINEILDISKIESGKLKLENSFFDPAYEFEIITELFSSLSSEKNIDYILYLDPKLPKKLYGDVLRIKQIMANLISNAIKFTPKDGKIMVEVQVLSLNETCSYQICVSDTGIGIEQKNQENIFEPFEQANSSISKRFGGTGLGLSISHNVLELM
ncbi:MAG: PAS domain-containing protein, partial [Campylobacteraceae bacterium]|nr:PAS domain-containing protein [Campylobacteraceae bacterium]